MLVLILVMHALVHAQSSIAWYTSDQEGMHIARAQNKPALIYFTSNNCPHCEEQWAAFGDAQVVNQSREFVPIRGTRWLEGYYGIRYLPAIVFTNSQGDEIYRLVGYHDAPALIDEMQYALRLSSNPAQTPFHDPYASDRKIPGFGVISALAVIVICGRLSGRNNRW